MSRIRAKNTGPELIARRVLREAGYSGYRLHYAKVPGRPDIAFVGRKVAVFVHGCFWHGCPNCKLHTPRSNSAFWAKKVTTNKARDQHKVQALRKMGWRVYTIWECGLRKSPQRTLARVLNELGST